MRPLYAAIALAALTTQAQQPFTLQQALSAPYSLSLTAAPVGNQFAWVENAEGVRNIWIASPTEPARQLTHYTQDDAQDIASLTWSPDATSIAYVYGAAAGASGKPANPDELHGQPLHILLQPLVPGAPVQDIGEGHAPLFMHGGCGLFFVRGGKIWARGFRPQPKLSSVTPRETPSTPEPNLLCDTAEQGNFQLVTDRGSASSLTLSPDGNRLAYISHRGTHSFLALYDLRALFVTFPAPSTGNDAAPSFSRDGKYLAWLRYPFTDASEFAQPRTSPNPWSIQILNVSAPILNLATNKARTLFQPEPNKPGSVEPRLATGEPHLLWTAPLIPSVPSASSADLSYRTELALAAGPTQQPTGPSGGLLFFSEADGWVRLYSIDPSSPTPTNLPTWGGEVEDAVISRDGLKLYYVSTGPGITCVPRPSCKRTFPLPQSSDIRTIWSLNLTAPDNSTDGPRTPVTVIATHPIELTDGTLVGLVSDAKEPMHPAILSRFPAPSYFLDGAPTPKDVHKDWLPKDYPSAQFVTPQQIIFPSSDKLFQLHSQLFLPPGKQSVIQLNPYMGPTTETVVEGKHPAILFFHGGPKRQMLLGYPSMDYYSNAYAMNQYLASRGYIVLSVNYRGGIGYGLNFRQCQHCGADGAAEYADALAAAAYLRSRPDVDASHIGIWGGSYGGYFTALALARNSDIFAAGVDFHGVHEWAREDNAPSDWLRSPTADPLEISRIAALAHASSPMADIDKWKSPVLLIHGDDDPEVAYAQTPLLADALRARNVPVEELIFPDELHGFLLHRNWLAAYEATAAFFDKTLKPPLLIPARTP